MRKWRKRLALCTAVAAIAGLPYAYHLPALANREETQFSIIGTDAAQRQNAHISLHSKIAFERLTEIKTQNPTLEIQESPDRKRVASYMTERNGNFVFYIMDTFGLEEKKIQTPVGSRPILPLWIDRENILFAISKYRIIRSNTEGDPPVLESSSLEEFFSIVNVKTTKVSNVQADEFVKKKESKEGALATFGLALLVPWLLSRKKHTNLLTCFGKHPYMATLSFAIGGAFLRHESYLMDILSRRTLPETLAQYSFWIVSSAIAGNALSTYLGSKEGGHLKNMFHGFGCFFSRRHREEMRVYERPFKVESDKGIRPLLARNPTGFLPAYRAFKADLLRLRDLPILAEIVALFFLPINYALCAIFPKSYSPKEHPGRAVELIHSVSMTGMFHFSNRGYNALCLEHVPAEYKAAGAMLLAALHEQRALLEECFPFPYALQNRALNNNWTGSASVFGAQAHTLWHSAIPEFLSRGTFRQLDVHSKSEVLEIPADEFLSATLRFLKRPSSEAPQLEAALTNSQWYEERLPSQIVVPVYFTPNHEGHAYLVSCYAGITLEEKLEQEPGEQGARVVEQCAELLWNMREHTPPNRTDPRKRGHSKRRLEETLLKYYSELKTETTRELLETTNVTDESLATCSPIAYRDATHRNWLFEKMLDGTEILRANDLEGTTMLPPTIDDVNLYESGPCLSNEQIESLVRTGARKMGRDEVRYLEEYIFTAPQRCLELVGFRIRDGVRARENGCSDIKECKLAKHNATRAEFYATRAYAETQDTRWKAYVNVAREIQELLR